MTEPLLLALIGAIGSVGTIIVQKAFSRKKDAVDIQSQIIQDLYKEISRLQVQIDELKKYKESSDKREEELLVRIEELEQVNKEQASLCMEKARIMGMITMTPEIFVFEPSLEDLFVQKNAYINTNIFIGYKNEPT
jgi:uncharacterized membrane protein (DUF106 family)